MPTTHLLRGASGAFVAAMLMPLAACGDDTIGDSSNRGSGTDTEPVNVEDAYIVPTFVPERCAIQLNAGASMRFTVANNSATDSERLLGISTTAADGARILGNADIPPHSTVGFGERSAKPVDAGGRVPSVRLEGLDHDLQPAMSPEVTFKFRRAGEITMRVPVEACPAQSPPPDNDMNKGRMMDQTG
jgi:copper(I)-binding protein